MDELWPSVPATPDARLTSEQPAPASRGVVGGPTVPESLPPGLNDGTPSSRRFEAGTSDPFAPLRAAVVSQVRYGPFVFRDTQHGMLLERLLQEHEERSKDTARLDWLLEHFTKVTSEADMAEMVADGEPEYQREGNLYFCWDAPPETLREAIDAARS